MEKRYKKCVITQNKKEGLKTKSPKAFRKFLASKKEKYKKANKPKSTVIK